MCRKIISLVSLFFVLVLCGRGLAEDYLWDYGDGTNAYWNSPNNWDPDGVPTATDTAEVRDDYGDANMPVIPPEVNALSDSVTVSSGLYQTNNPLLTVQGNLTVGNQMFVGSWWWTGARGTLILEPGSKFDLTGNPGRAWIGYRCEGNLIMKGGTWTVNELELARGDDCTPYPPKEDPVTPGAALAYLDGGTITVYDFFTMRMGYPSCGAEGAVQWPDSNGHLDVNQGTLIIDADAKAQLDQYVADGWITAYGNQYDPCFPPADPNLYRPGTDPNNFWMPKRASVLVDYDIRNRAKTTLTAYLGGNGEAYNLSPAYGARGVVLKPTLTWSPGNYVKYGGLYKGSPNAQYGNGHHVFLHTAKSWIDSATLDYPLGPAYGHIIGAQDACSFSIEANYPGGILKLDTDYYWCIIEANDANVAPIKWTYKSLTQVFRTVGGRASNPNPGNGAVLEYYLDEVLDVNLTWDRGYFAAGANGHDVYLGTKFNDVNEANLLNDPNGVYKGRQTAQTYHLDNLKLGQIYYWRIDEVNDPCLWKGITWNFTVAPYRIADAFDYMGDEQLRAAWVTNSTSTYPCAYYGDGGTVNSDRGTMQFIYDNDGGPYPGGYDYYSEAGYTYPDPGKDWTQGDATQDVKALGLSFQGVADNNDDPNYDRMYVAVEDTSGNIGMVLQDNPSAQKNTKWQEWNIDLRDFSDAGVNLTAVKHVYIGFGVRCNWWGGNTGGHGTVWFDNLRLYIPRCLGTPGYRQLADIAGGTGTNVGDCKVDTKDLDAMATDWLKKDMLVLASNPGSNGLVVHYKFDDVSGPNVADSSSNGFTGTAMYRTADPCDSNIIYTTLVDANWDPCGMYGGCINFAGLYSGPNEVNYGVSIPNNVFASIGNSMTITMWINAPPNHIMKTDWRPLLNTDSGINVFCPTPGPPAFTWGDDVHWTGGTPTPGTYDTTLDWGDGGPGDFIGWNHYAFVHDADGRVHTLYHNGELVDDAARKPEFNYAPIADANQFWLCASASGMGQWWKGRIDDFRIYNRALTYGEIVYLAGGTQIYNPLTSPANLSDKEPMGSRWVNLKDLAVLAEEWMQADPWPLGTSP